MKEISFYNVKGQLYAKIAAPHTVNTVLSRRKMTVSISAGSSIVTILSSPINSTVFTNMILIPEIFFLPVKSTVQNLNAINARENGFILISEMHTFFPK